MNHDRGLNKKLVLGLLVIPLIFLFAFFGKAIVKKASSQWNSLTRSDAAVEPTR